MINYNQIFTTVKVTDNKLLFDVKDIAFLNVFETTELFFYATSLPDYTSINIKGTSLTENYLKQIHFFQTLAHVKNITLPSNIDKMPSPTKGLFQLQAYTYKPEFYGNYEAIITAFGKIGLSGNTSMLIGSSLGEIVDNAFSHNIGQWSNNLGPLVIGLMQNDTLKREIMISICDFGIGFLQTLHHNYPEISTEKEAIKLALQANTTGRPNQRGGNGLLFLQKNIFNGFKGTLNIRSTNTLIKVTDFQKFELINDTLPFKRGVNICFSVHY